MIEKKCLRCNKPFSVHDYVVRDGRGKYCSKKCHYGEKIERTCLNCNKNFLARRSLVKRTGAKFCSRKCFHDYNKGETSFNYGKRHTKEAIEKMKKNRKGWKMSQQQKDFLSKIKSGKKQQPCSEEKKKKIGIANKGENNGQWKGGITPLRVQIYKSKEEANWRNSIYQRDQYSCQMPDCEHNNKRLNVHHIIKFSKILKIHNIKTLNDAIGCKELWDIDNGITLCYDCHLKTKMKEQEYAPLFHSLVAKKKQSFALVPMEQYQTNMSQLGQIQ